MQIGTSGIKSNPASETTLMNLEITLNEIKQSQNLYSMFLFMLDIN